MHLALTAIMKVLISILLAFGPLFAVTVHAQNTFFTRLGADIPDKIILSCEWDSLLKPKEMDSWDAQLTLVYKDAVETWKAGLSIRGKYRRIKCTFPPLEINLKKGALRKQGLLEFDKLKLVTHCNTENTDPANIYEELLIYQLYALLTPASFNVLSLNVNYEYPNGKSYEKDAPALLLEPTAEVAHRLGGQELEQYSVPADSLNGVSYCRNALFQFMIGNFDWELATQRNVKMIGQPGNYELVPYDFDFSAIVSPSYARVPEEYGLKDFRDRIYKGEYFAEQLPTAISEFLSKKELILSHVMQFEALSKTRRREIVDYLNLFFSFIENPNCTIEPGTILSYQD